ncbi:HlyD family type I secretion periplasmic adaptor subunit [Shewanella sp. UCD-KL21]|uniref:HlyD family type I secretion periplasmic adaptor subunit n=1 Tax=Shewanella sp. UCD-KL21 TaxID=1917164 RepID=UPI0009708873|nr:HlyD family type I secretion periplasmic adaptor subunit [Shewanella sp. UCD-KL21]
MKGKDNLEQNFEDIIEESINSVHSDSSSVLIAKNSSNSSQKVSSVAFVFFFILLIWGSQAELEITVATRGEILLNSDIEKVQHLEGGILEKLYVVPGDIVYKGQKIAQLRSKDKVGDLAVNLFEINQLRIELIKYESLISQQEPDFSAFKDYPQTLKIQQEQWREENSKNVTSDDLMEHDIAHKTVIIDSMKQRILSSTAQLNIIKKQLAIKEQLYKEEMASYTDVLNMQVQEMNMLREIENLEESVVNEGFLLTRLTKQQENTKFIRDSEYRIKVVALDKELSIKSKMLPSISDKVDRLFVYSPVDGTVDKLNYNYISAIISPGDSIADITPLNNALRAEIKIARKDIGFIVKGQKVKLKLDAYNFAKYGVIDAVISSISRGSYEEKEEEFFLAELTINKNYLENKGVKYHLAPYMEFTADVKTGSRKIIDYALKPIMAALEESFNER